MARIENKRKNNINKTKLKKLPPKYPLKRKKKSNEVDGIILEVLAHESHHPRIKRMEGFIVFAPLTCIKNYNQNS